MTAIAILYDGTDITADVDFRGRPIFVCRADGSPGTADLRVRDTGHVYASDYFHGGGTLELYIDGQREWDGWVLSVRRSYAFDVDDTRNPHATPRYWALQGCDRNLLFTRRWLFNQDDPTSPFADYPAGTADDVVIKDYLANKVDLSRDGLDTESGIEHISTPGFFEPFVLSQVGSPWGEMFSDVCGQTGGVSWIGPDRVVYYADDSTVTAPFALVDREPGDGEVAYRELDWGGDASQLANDAFVWGAGLGGGVDPVFARYQSTDSITEHGLWQWSDQYIGATKVDTVQRRAQTYVEGSVTHHRGHGEDQDLVACSIFKPGLRVGMVVDMTSVVYDRHDTIPVRSMTISFPTPWDVRYDLLLSHTIDVPYAYVDPWVDTIDQEIPTPIPTVATNTDSIDEFDRVLGTVGSPFGPWGTATSGYVWFGDSIGWVDGTAGYATFVSDDFPSVDRDLGSGTSTDTDFIAFPAESSDFVWRWALLGYSPMIVPFAADDDRQVLLHGLPAFSPSVYGFPAWGPNARAADWHLSRVRFLNDVGMIRTWFDGDPEPDTWDFVTPFAMAPRGPGFAVYMPEKDLSLFGIRAFTVDWIRRTTLGGPLPLAPGIENQPLGISGDTFLTLYAYQPGSLQVTYQGQALRPGIDFTETDPSTGEFRLAEVPLYPGSISVHYAPDSTVPTGKPPSSGRTDITLGLDVSHFQGQYDFQGAFRNGARFAGVQLTVGTWVDTWGVHHVQSALAARMWVMPYHFLNDEAGGTQADFFHELLSGFSGDAGQLYPILDIESKEGARQQQVLEFLDRWFAQAYGRIGVYSGPGEFVAVLGSRTFPLAEKYPDIAVIWNADYRGPLVSSPDDGRFSLYFGGSVYGWGAWRMAQFVQDGGRFGTDGDVFAGTEAELGALFE